LPDAAGSDTHPVANGRTNAKGIPFNKAFEFVHTANLKNLWQTGQFNPEKKIVLP
jgi:hypothetical protein